MEDLKAYVKSFNEIYSLLFDWFSVNFDFSLLVSESDDILDFIERSKLGDDNIIQMFKYEYDILMSDDQLQELKELIKSVNN